VETDHLAVRDVPGCGQPAMAVWVGGDRVAAQWQAGANASVDGLCD